MAKHKPLSVIPHTYEASVPLDDLNPHPSNPNRGDVGAIHTSIETLGGFYGVVLAQSSNKRILAGHHRIEAARQSGIDHVPVIYLDVDDAQALAIIVGDNQTNRLGSWDDDLLLATLQQVNEYNTLGATGFDGDAIDDLLKHTNPPFEPLPPGSEPRLDQKNPVTCPNCQHEFVP